MYPYCWFAAQLSTFLREYRPYFNISLMGNYFLIYRKINFITG